MPTFSFSQVVELSHPLAPGNPGWPGDPALAFEPLADLARDGYFLRGVRMSEHSGTHLNAPAHMAAGGATAEAIPAQRLVLPAVVIDVRTACSADADYALPLAGLQAWEVRHGRVPAGCLALLCTGWSARWPEPRRFLNRDSQGGLHFPGFSLAAARCLLDERGAAGLGSDAAGVEPGLDDSYAVNRLALARGALVVECLANLEQLPALGAWIVVGRLPLAGASGAPAAVLALVP